MNPPGFGQVSGYGRAESADSAAIVTLCRALTRFRFRQPAPNSRKFAICHLLITISAAATLTMYEPVAHGLPRKLGKEELLPYRVCPSGR